jgi:hypothetical protein
MWGSFDHPDRRVLLRRGAKLRCASLAAEVDSDTLVLGACRRFRWIELHPAHRIAFFSLLHMAIVTVFAHFALFQSDQGSAAMKMAAGPAILAFAS